MEKVLISLSRYEDMKEEIAVANNTAHQLSDEIERLNDENGALTNQVSSLNKTIDELIESCISYDYTMFEEINGFNIDVDKLVKYIEGNFREMFIEKYNEGRNKKNEQDNN